MSPMRPKAGPNPFLEATAGQMLAAAAARFPDRDAIIAGDLSIPYARLVILCERLARGFLALGIRKDDKVALWLPNRPAWLIAQYACAMIGAVVVALNTRYKAHELSYILRQSDTTTLVLTDHLGPVDFLETLEECALREACEEVGVEIGLVRLLCVTDHCLPEENQHWVSPAYLGRVLAGDAHNCEPEKTREVRWFPLDKLPPNLTITARNAIQAYSRSQ